MKARRQGNDIVLTVPSILNIEPGKEYVAIKGKLGSITYIPKVENIFEEAIENGESLRFEDDYQEDTHLNGSEED